jgi:hypothetical protein
MIGAVIVCAFCQREPGAVPLHGNASEHVCGRCVARLASRLPALVHLFARGPKLPPAAELLDPGSRDDFNPREIEDAFAEFKNAAPSKIESEAIDTHLDLALAYRTMGLLADAFAEFALVLQHGRGEQLARVLDALFGKKSGFQGDIAALRDALYPA